jgi:hypothetical protein
MVGCILIYHYVVLQLMGLHFVLKLITSKGIVYMPYGIFHNFIKFLKNSIFFF